MNEATLFKFGKWIDYGKSYSKGKKYPPKAASSAWVTIVFGMKISHVLKILQMH